MTDKSDKTSTRPSTRPRPEPTESDRPKSPTVDRWTIPVEGGRIVWDRLRPERAQALRAMVGGAAPGDAPAPVAGARPALSDEAAMIAGLVPMIYQGLNTVVVARAARLMNCAPADAAVLALTPIDIDALTPATVRVFTKYGGGLFTKYGDEATLILGILAIYGGKIAQLQAQLSEKSRRVRESGQIAQDARSDAPRMTLAETETRAT